MYTITVDRPTEVVEVTLAGMMPPDEVAAYIADVRRALVANGLRHYAMVIDVSDCPIQSQDMVRSMGEHMASMPRARALAIVTGSSLARLQVRRLFKQPYARITATLAEGRDWVLHGTEPATPDGRQRVSMPRAVQVKWMRTQAPMIGSPLRRGGRMRNCHAAWRIARARPEPTGLSPRLRQFSTWLSGMVRQAISAQLSGGTPFGR